MEGKIRVTKQIENKIINLHQEWLGYVCKKNEDTADKNAVKKDIPGFVQIAELYFL